MANVLTPEQYEAIAYLSMPKGERPTLGEIAKRLNVDPATLWRWRQNEAFQSELKRRITVQTQERLPELMDALIDHGIGGNAAAAKLILQANGMLTDNVEVNVKETPSIDLSKLQERLKRATAQGNRAEADKDAV